MEPDIREKMNKIYREMSPDKIPWNMPSPPEMLVNAIGKMVSPPSELFEGGCGLGNYALYFAKLGYKVTGADISEEAIKSAVKSAEKYQVDCKFIVADLTADNLSFVEAFDLAYDWELLHHVFPEYRNNYIRNIHRALKKGGKYISLFFSEEDEHFGGKGKYRTTPIGTLLYFSSEEEVRRLIQESFHIHELTTIEIKGKFSPHKAIFLLAEKVL